MQFNLTIELDNEAFKSSTEIDYPDAFRWELARALNALAKKVAETGIDAAKIRDSNGNTVGFWSIA